MRAKGSEIRIFSEDQGRAGRISQKGSERNIAHGPKASSATEGKRAGWEERLGERERGGRLVTKSVTTRRG